MEASGYKGSSLLHDNIKRRLHSSPLPVVHPLEQAVGIHWLIYRMPHLFFRQFWLAPTTESLELCPKGLCHVYCNAQALKWHSMGGPAL